ncbi:hypothetical protein [Pedobacter mendelii]|uniref:DUF4421 domain-containing protein n=1 Tax=Pedobacter mendelii TaxID=1908240 RepID=A0ABQ2BDW7_9SPHI|nr:hypothetical protein [Pedobacter mendelii]GGI23701.1 hypothetical protein GCM10008119_08960 [Pedobacter mendelii]
MKTIIIIGSILLFYIHVEAQTLDSIKRETKEFITDKFPTTRPIDVQFEQFGSRNFDSKLFGESFQRGKIDNESRLRIALNIPVFKTRKYVITTSLRYKYNHYDFNDVTPSGLYGLTNQRSEMSFHYLSAAGSFTYFSKLFGKPVIYNATLNVDGDENGIQRVKGLFAAALVLKRSQNTLITVGLLGLIDRTAISPILPSFSWKQSFSNSQWSLDLILPRHLKVQRPLFKNGRLSLGSELLGEGFYVKPGQFFLPGTYEYTQLEIKSGATYEHALGSKLILTLKGGIANTLVARLYQKNAAFSDYVYENTQDGVGYFNIGISFNPFKANKGGRK